jgi:MFS family permease
MDLVVLGWLALSFTDSAFMVGVAAFCRAVPMMAFGPFAGVLADRLPRVSVMSAVQVVNVLASSALAILFATGLAGFGILVALTTRNVQATNTSFLLFFPLLFLTPNFVPSSGATAATLWNWNAIDRRTVNRTAKMAQRLRNPHL